MNNNRRGSGGGDVGVDVDVMVAKTEKRRTHSRRRRRAESVHEDDGRSYRIPAVALYCQYDARGVRSNRRFSVAAAFAAKVKFSSA